MEASSQVSRPEHTKLMRRKPIVDEPWRSREATFLGETPEIGNLPKRSKTAATAHTDGGVDDDLNILNVTAAVAVYIPTRAWRLPESAGNRGLHVIDVYQPIPV